MGKLDGKIAIITGAAQGMGEAHARLFVQEGARVVLTDVQRERGESLAAELGPGACFMAHDVSGVQDWAQAVSLAQDRFGAVNVLVNNAGVIGPLKPGVTLSEADFRRVFEINELGVYLGMQAVVPVMKANGGGSIINVSSIAGMLGMRASSNIAYVATKFAVRGMTKYVAAVHGPDGIRVNSIHPGVIMTPMMAEVLDDAGGDLAAAIPLGRLADPSEVSNLALFLASDDSSYISGAEHVIDAGLTAG